MPRPRPGVLIDAHVPESTWMHRAVCRGLSSELFYPDDKCGSEAAKLVCSACPVRAECLEYALELHERWGVWGGTSEHERRRIAARRRQLAVATA